jgi:hypothetical protein
MRILVKRGVTVDYTYFTAAVSFYEAVAHSKLVSGVIDVTFPCCQAACIEVSAVRTGNSSGLSKQQFRHVACVCVCVCVCVCARACVRACVCVCVFFFFKPE